MLAENKLKAKIVECNLNIEQVSKQIGMDKATFYRKMAKNSFLVREIDALAKVLSLTSEEATSIFFAPQGADMQLNETDRTKNKS